MNDEKKTKVQLMHELQEMRKRVADLERNNTKLDQAEETLEERIEDPMRLTQFCFDHAKIAIHQVGMDGRILNANPYAARMLGYSAEELVGLYNFDIDPHLNEETLRTDLKSVMGGIENRGSFETVHVRKDGAQIPVEITANLLEYDGRQFSICFIQDISERKLAETILIESENRLRELTANVPGVVIQFRITRDQIYTNEFLNSKITEIFGLEQNSETILDEFYRHIPDTEKSGFAVSLGEAIDSRAPWMYEGRFNRPDGKTIWFSGHAIPRDEGDALVYYGILTDITLRKDMEASLRVYQFIFDKATIGIFQLGEKAEILDVNEQVCRSLGYSREELCKMEIYDIAPHITPDRWSEIMADLRCCGSKNIETINRRKNGELFPIQVLDNVMTFEGREVHVGFVQDITNRKQMELALKESEQRLDLALSVANEGIWDLNLLEDIAYLDTRGYTMAGYKPGEFPATIIEIRKRIHENDREYVKSTFRRYLAGDLKTYEVQFRFLRKDGAYMWFFSKGKIVAWDDSGNPARFISINADITQRKQYEEELRRLRNYLSNIIDSMPSIIVAVDGDGNVTQWNNQAEQTTGLSSDAARKKPLATVFPRLAETAAQVQDAIRESRVISTSKASHKVYDETRFENITIFPLMANGVEGAVIRVDDVTEQVRMEEMMIQSEKMLTVGGLAAGMAHEINNPLAGILQTANVMASRLDPDADIPANRRSAEEAGVTMEAISRFMKARNIPRMLDTIIASGRRMAGVVDNMLSFARKSDAEVSFHSLEALLDKTVELAVTDYDLKKAYDFKQIAIQREYAEDLPEVPCEAGKIQQVLLNLLRNGAQAMQAAGTESPRFIFRTRFETDRNIAVMEIEDNGPGMEEKIRKRIFEPFFTTKPVGVGTGLGLSVSYFIITESHSGEMAVHSTPGGGAKFTICLPLHGTRGPL